MRKNHKRIILIFQLFLLINSASFALAEKRVNQLDDIVVTGTKTQHTLQDVPVKTIVISQKDIKRKNAQNVMDLLKEIPGIQTANHDDVFGTYTWMSKMRGLDFNAGYALILIDGQRVMGCGQSGGMGEYGVGLNHIPLEMIDRIEIVKGPGSALYGSDAMAGVVNIITKKAPKEAAGTAGISYGRYHVQKDNADGTSEEANGSRNMAKTYASYGDRITDNIGYYIHYSYESADDVSEDPLKSWKHSFLGKLDATINQRSDFSLKTEVSDYEKEDNREEESYRVSAFVDFQINPSQSFSLRGYTYNWDFTHGYPGCSYGYKFGNVDYNQAEMQYTWNTHEANTLVIGGEMQIQGINYIIENDDGSVINVNEDVKTSSLYIQDEAVFFDKLTLIGGARYDHHSTFGDEINPKLSVMFEPGDTTRIRAGFGTSFKSPTTRQLYYNAPYRHSSYYARSNQDLKPETAFGYGLSIEQWFLDKDLMVDLGYFRNEVKDMVIREDTGTLHNGLPLMEYKNVEKAFTQGIESMCRAYLTDRFILSFSYTYTDTENKESGKDLTYVSQHSASFSPSYEWERYGFGISATVSLNSKQYTNTSNSEYIDKGMVFDAKMVKQLSKNTRLTFEADDIFDSVPSRDDRYFTGRAFTLKVDFAF